MQTKEKNHEKKKTTSHSHYCVKNTTIEQNILPGQASKNFNCNACNAII